MLNPKSPVFIPKIRLNPESPIFIPKSLIKESEIDLKILLNKEIIYKKTVLNKKRRLRQKMNKILNNCSILFPK